MTESRARTRRRRKEPIDKELRLLDWAGRGATRAESDGRTLLIDRGIPGEDVIARVDTRRRPWRGVVTDVLQRCPDRVAPPCPYYLQDCGGCQWQHVDYPSQVQTKVRLVNRDLEAAGLAARVDRAHSLTDPWRYRHTAAIAIGWEAGFRPRGRRGILEIHDCPISHPLIGRLAHELNVALRGGSLPNYHGKAWLDCTVVGRSGEERLQVVLQGIEGLTLENHPELPDVARTIMELSQIESVSYRHRSGRVEALEGPLMATVEVEGRQMYVPAGAFVQTNLSMVSRVLGSIRSSLSPGQARTLADIYGGVGTFGLPLADLVERVILVELDASAVEAAAKTAAAWGVTNVEFVSRHAERALPDLPFLDAAVVDPPRSGLGPVVTRAILENGIPLVFYVSCAPSSLARDLAELSAAYEVESLEVFDFYPQTYHVESLAVLRRC